MPERKVGTETLLKHKVKIDSELATRNYLEKEIFESIHSKCKLIRKRVDWQRVGYNPTWNDVEYAPIKVLRCEEHAIDSARFLDWEAYTAGEVGSGNS